MNKFCLTLHLLVYHLENACTKEIEYKDCSKEHAINTYFILIKNKTIQKKHKAMEFTQLLPCHLSPNLTYRPLLQSSKDYLLSTLPHFQ